MANPLQHPIPPEPAPRRDSYDTEPHGTAVATPHGGHATPLLAATTDRRYLLSLSLAALGVVYGDIGTSPLYALRESFLPAHGVAVGVESVLGVLSLVFWSLVL